MVYVLGIIQFVLICYICIYELRNKSSALFLWATLFLMFGIMHLMTSFTGNSDYSAEVISQASAFVIGFCLIYLFFRYIFNGNMRTVASQKLTYSGVQENLEESNYSGGFLLVIYLIVIVVQMAMFIRSSGGLSLTSWSSQRAYHASQSYVNSSQIFDLLFYALAGLLVIFFLQKKYVYVICITAVILIDVLIFRRRVEILPLLCGFIVIFLLRLKKIKLRTVLYIIVAIVLIIYIIYGLRAMRYYGTWSNFVDTFTWSDFNSKIQTFLSNDDGELGLRKYFYYFISEKNNFPGFGEGATYLRILLIFVPTNWAGGIKPEDFAITMGNAVGLGEGGSMHPTLFGDAYANFGMFGMLVGFIWASITSVVDRIILSRKNSMSMILLYVLWSVGYCIIGRGSVYNGFWTVLYGTIIILVVEFILYRVNLPHISFTLRKKNSKK